MQTISNRLRTELVLCECASIEHQIVFVKIDNADPEIYMEVHLRTGRNFWQRLAHGIAYAFGKKSRYGAWDEFVLGPDQLSQIKNFIENESNS